MDYRPLGRTGLSVSALCLGTMTFGEQNTEAEGFAQMDLSCEHGVNFFDAAELYPIPPDRDTQGRTERIIGNWFKQRGNRNKIIMATKVIGRSDMNWFREDGSAGRLVRSQIEEAVNQSLRNLQTDYIDLYQVHWPDRHVGGFGSNPTRWATPEKAADENSIESVLEVMNDLVQAGKIRHVGISNESPWGTMTYLKHAEMRQFPRVASIQNAYSLLNRTFETGLAEIAHRENVGLLAYSVLGQGYLSGKYRKGVLPKGARKTLYDRLQRYEKEGANDAMEAYFDMAEQNGIDAAQLAIAFACSRDFVTSVILGATSLQQLSTNLEAIKIDLNDDILQQIDEVHQRYGNPCP